MVKAVAKFSIPCDFCHANNYVHRINSLGMEHEAMNQICPTQLYQNRMMPETDTEENQTHAQFHRSNLFFP